MNNSKSIVILTSTFPFEQTETFLKNELTILERYFTRIYILPTSSAIKNKHAKLEGYTNKVIFLQNEYNRLKTKQRKHFLIKLMVLAFSLSFYKNFFNELVRRPKKVIQLRNCLKILQSFYTAISINQVLDHVDVDIYYSYWLNSASLALALNKSPHIKVSRAHGSDIYEIEPVGFYHPFRKVVLKNLDSIFAISKFGTSYLSNQYNGNIKLAYLGSFQIKNKIEHQKDNTPDQLIIVSCSNIIELKRLDLIIDILRKLNIPYHWHHFGDGNLRDKIERKAKSLLGERSVTFHGYLQNKDLLNFYCILKPDIFINMSDSEGIPLSMMEAQNLGIPILARNVGGISELVIDSINGFLIEDLNIEHMASLLEEYYHFDQVKKNTFITNSQSLWKEKFNGVNNFSKFAKELQNLLGKKK